jgi:hypothetical protein
MALGYDDGHDMTMQSLIACTAPPSGPQILTLCTVHVCVCPDSATLVRVSHHRDLVQNHHSSAARSMWLCLFAIHALHVWTCVTKVRDCHSVLLCGSARGLCHAGPRVVSHRFVMGMSGQPWRSQLGSVSAKHVDERQEGDNRADSRTPGLRDIIGCLSLPR